MSEAVLIESILPGGIAKLCLNRPKSMNSLDEDLLDRLAQAFEGLQQRQDVRVILLCGNGRAFCSGADLTWLRSPDMSPFEKRISAFHHLILSIVQAKQPVLAALNGPAAGFGCDVAFACDLRIAAEGAFFEESFSKIGLMPDGGGTFWTEHYLGARAFSQLAFAERIENDQALTLGLLQDAYPAEDFEEKSLAYAQNLAARSPRSLAQIKKARTAAIIAPLREALEREKEGQRELLNGADFKEGLTAFFEKRAPQFI